MIGERIFMPERNILLFLLLSAGILSCLFLPALLERLLRPSADRHPAAVSDRIFLFLFFAILLLPWLQIDDRAWDEKEKRSLAPKPALYENGRLNETYGRQMESWLNDRFYGREEYIKLHSKLNQFLMGDRYENGYAFMGKDNWLFFKGDRSVESYQRRLQYTEEQLRTIADNLMRQKAWYERHGMKFSVMIAPNKAEIYGEYYPPGIHQAGGRDRMECLADYMRQHTDVSFLYTKEELLSHKDEGLLYRKDDTHWSPLGAFYGYRAWMDMLKEDVDGLEPLEKSDTVCHEIRMEDGDLVRLLRLRGETAWDDDSYLEYRPEGMTYSLEVLKLRPDGLERIIHTVRPGRPYKVILFRDSFTISMLPYIAATFGEVYFIWDTDYDAYKDLILSEEPDLVLLEVVGRYADSLLTDYTFCKS